METLVEVDISEIESALRSGDNEILKAIFAKATQAVQNGKSLRIMKSYPDRPAELVNVYQDISQVAEWKQRINYNLARLGREMI